MTRNLTLIAGFAAMLAAAPLSHAGSVELGMQIDSVTGSKATFTIFADFVGDLPGDEIDFFSIDVTGSSDALTAADTDFSRFMFTPTDFDEFFSIADGLGVGGYFPDPDTIMPGFGINLGVLMVDLSGFAGGQSLTVSVNGADTDFSGILNGVFVDSFREESVLGTDPLSLTFQTTAMVPEPAAVLLTGLSVGALALRRRR